ncbi:MAG: phage polymerase-related protein [Rhodospirillales bacterium]|jgi:DNA polymerase|nr:phage polymerase-related protein [Rhodospirillales bacterium]
MPRVLAKEPVRSAAEFIDPDASLTQLREAAKGCTSCDLYKHATQTVFGEGSRTALLMLIGEQPGDSEDKEGYPFVGPAGRLLDKALADAGIERKRVYVTNVVKHFKYIVRGKKRLHKKPTVIEIRACRPWLEAEIEKVRPQGILCLGATPAQTLLGRAFRVTKDRGRKVASNLAPVVMATVHPSSLLREPDPKARDENYRRFVSDLKKAAKAVK